MPFSKTAKTFTAGAGYGLFVLMMEYSIIWGVVRDHFTLQQVGLSLLLYVFIFGIAAAAVKIFSDLWSKIGNKRGEYRASILIILAVFWFYYLIYDKLVKYFEDWPLRFYLLVLSMTIVIALLTQRVIDKILRRGGGKTEKIYRSRAMGFAAGLTAGIIICLSTDFVPYMGYIAVKAGIGWWIGGVVFAGGWYLLLRGGRGKIGWIKAGTGITIILTGYAGILILWNSVIDRPVEGGCNIGKPNVIFLVIDALRADRVGVYGNERGLTPHIDAFSRQGTVFRRAYANSSWTKPSTASFFSGKYPGMVPVDDIWDGLPKSVVTFAGRLRQEGYYTRCISANLQITEWFNYQQGFDDFVYHEGFEKRFLLFPPNLFIRNTPYITELCYRWGLFNDGDEITVNNAVIPWLKRNKDKQYFLYVHYFGPHFPYSPLRSRYSKGEKLSAQEITLLKQLRRPDTGDLVEDRTMKTVRDRYDDEVLEADCRVGEALKTLEELGGWENTLVIITADHGEEFLEHGMGGHGNSMFQEVLQVPLIIKLPGKRQVNVIEKRAELLDLAPTIYEVCGIDPGIKLEGTSLLPVMLNDSLDLPEQEKAYYGEVRPTREAVKAERIYAYMQGNFKLLRNEMRDKEHTVQYVLYNLQTDPGEKTDVKNLYPEIFTKMKAGLDSLYDYCRNNMMETEEEVKTKRSPEERRKLRALGYGK